MDRDTTCVPINLNMAMDVQCINYTSAGTQHTFVVVVVGSNLINMCVCTCSVRRDTFGISKRNHIIPSAKRNVHSSVEAPHVLKCMLVP